MLVYVWPNLQYKEEAEHHTTHGLSVGVPSSQIEIMSEDQSTPSQSVAGDVPPDYQNVSPPPPKIQLVPPLQDLLVQSILNRVRSSYNLNEVPFPIRAPNQTF